ncbi:glycosyltransferase family 92 protein RCOM_0530710-like [Primulina eburnea]|uniref:glycosyltransferase family 92 protein RCOM_0530710-like n=1 Tax=Primulina eburnea TaxID=1245227 RepID=UPI003C6BD72B
MDSSDQRRKRKRVLRQPYPPFYCPSYMLSVRFLAVCLGFLTFLYILISIVPFNSSAFRPVLVVSSLSLLSSSSSRTVKSVQDFDSFLFPWKIEDRVLFPDHVLLFVSGGKEGGLMKKIDVEGLECVYREIGSDFVVKRVISVDEFDELRSIVRCPLPSKNYSALVTLRVSGKNGILKEENNGLLVNNQTLNSWEKLAYSATLDGDTVVLFVKGLNLRGNKDSDPSLFSCHFGLGKWERNETFTLTTKALSAAQEVVRCPLPRSLGNNPIKANGIRVTIGVTPRIRGRAYKRLIVPSIAKITDFGSEGKKRKEGKYKLCACTMVWNQASSIREWIMYHSWLGVERWFIYDNNSDDGIDEVIQELDRDNYNVTRHVWPWIKTQEAGFSMCALRAKDECDWVSFMDVDEYFYFPYSTPKRHRLENLGYAGQHSLRMLVANVSSTSPTIAEIRTSCHSFGPSGLSTAPSQGVTVGYTCRLQSPERHKSIIRPDALDATLLNVVHHFRLKKGFRYLNLPLSTVIVNHYKYQVWEVFRAKFYRRVATYVADWQESQKEGSRDRAPGLGTEAIEPPDWPQKFCEVWDTGLRDFVLSNLADLSTGLLPWESRYAWSG